MNHFHHLTDVAPVWKIFNSHCQTFEIISFAAEQIISCWLWNGDLKHVTNDKCGRYWRIVGYFISWSCVELVVMSFQKAFSVWVFVCACLLTCFYSKKGLNQQEMYVWLPSKKSCCAYPGFRIIWTMVKFSLAKVIYWKLHKLDWWEQLFRSTDKFKKLFCSGVSMTEEWSSVTSRADYCSVLTKYHCVSVSFSLKLQVSLFPKPCLFFRPLPNQYP